MGPVSSRTDGNRKDEPSKGSILGEITVLIN